MIESIRSSFSQYRVPEWSLYLADDPHGVFQHTVPGPEAEAKDIKAGTPGDSPEAALAEVGLDPFSICRLLSAEAGHLEDW